MSEKGITKSIRIDGMTCVSCENRIRHALEKTEGIISAKVSYVKGSAEITYLPEKIQWEQIEIMIKDLGYGINKKSFDIIKRLTTLISIYAIYMILKHIGFVQIFSAFPLAQEGMGYGMLFLIGLLTSVHCVAMCGGICLTQCVKRANATDTKVHKLETIRPSLFYNLGRVISYTLIGGIVGTVGSVVSFSGNLKGIVQIVAGVFMVIMAFNMMNLFAPLRKLSLRMPNIFAGKINTVRMNKSPLIVGLFNGFMPCGPLQAMQLYALSTGSFLKGALSMFLFSMGTVPLMLTFGVISTFLNKKFASKMMSVGAVFVMILGIFMFRNGLALSGISLPSETSKVVSGNIAVIENGVQTVTTTLQSGSYEAITVQKGIPVKWIINADSKNINGCNDSIYIPEFNITYGFVPGENVITFTPTKSGIFPYSCWMGMIRSKIIVVDDITKPNQSETNDKTSDTAEDTDVFTSNPVVKAIQYADVTISTDRIAVAEIVDDTQIVEITMDQNGFSPAVVVIQRGYETEWNIKGVELDESNRKLLVPSYYSVISMEEGDNILYFLPVKDFDFSTGDYSYFGYVKVVDDISKINLDDIKKEVEEYKPVITDLSSYNLGGGGSCCH